MRIARITIVVMSRARLDGLPSRSIYTWIEGEQLSNRWSKRSIKLIYKVEGQLLCDISGNIIPMNGYGFKITQRERKNAEGGSKQRTLEWPSRRVLYSRRFYGDFAYGRRASAGLSMNPAIPRSQKPQFTKQRAYSIPILSPKASSYSGALYWTAHLYQDQRPGSTIKKDSRALCTARHHPHRTTSYSRQRWGIKYYTNYSIWTKYLPTSQLE